MRNIIYKINKNGLLLIAAILLYGNNLNSMKRPLSSQEITSQPTEQRLPRILGTKIVWVQTSDGQLLQVPQWQIDQMKLLQILFAHQKGKNSEKNPIKASMVNSEQLLSLQEALDHASTGNLDYLYKKYENAPEGSIKAINILFNTAVLVEAMGLASLLANFVFPKDIQKEILSSSQIIAPVINHLQKSIIEYPQEGIEGDVIAVSSDGSYIISKIETFNKRMNNLIIWDSKTNKKIKTLYHNHSIKNILLSPDNNYIVAWSWNGLTVWDIKTENQQLALQSEDGLNCAAFSPDNKYIVIGQGIHNGYLTLWDITTGNQIALLQGHNAQVECVSFTYDGTYIVSGSYGSDEPENNLIVWDGHTGKLIKILPDKSSGIDKIISSPKNNYIATDSIKEENNVTLWNLDTDEQKTLPIKYADAMAFNPRGIAIACVLNDTISLYNIISEQIKILRVNVTMGFSIESLLVFSPDENYIILVLYDGGYIAFLNNDTGEIIQKIPTIENITYERLITQFIQITLSTDNNYINLWLLNGQKNLVTWTLPSKHILDYLANNINISQARFIYRLYLATINNVSLTIDTNDPDYTIFMSFPKDKQEFIRIYFPFKIISEADVIPVEKAQLEKQLTGSFEEKKAKVINMIKQETDKNSIKYKALQKILNDFLEMEKLFFEELK